MKESVKLVLSVVAALIMVSIAAYRIGVQTGIKNERTEVNANVAEEDRLFHAVVDETYDRGYSNGVASVMSQCFNALTDMRQQCVMMEKLMWQARLEAAESGTEELRGLDRDERR